MRRMRKLTQELKERKEREAKDQRAAGCEASSKTEGKKSYPWSIMPKRSPAKKIQAMVEFFNGQKEEPDERMGKFVALKRSLSSLSLGGSRRTSTIKTKIDTTSNSSGRIRRVCFSTVDLTQVDDTVVPFADESSDFSSDYEEISADEQADGCAIPDVKSLIDKFSEL